MCSNIFLIARFETTDVGCRSHAASLPQAILRYCTREYIRLWYKMRSPWMLTLYLTPTYLDIVQHTFSSKSPNYTIDAIFTKFDWITSLTSKHTTWNRGAHLEGEDLAPPRPSWWRPRSSQREFHKQVHLSMKNLSNCTKMEVIDKMKLILSFLHLALSKDIKPGGFFKNTFSRITDNAVCHIRRRESTWTTCTFQDSLHSLRHDCIRTGVGNPRAKCGPREHLIWPASELSLPNSDCKIASKRSSVISRYLDSKPEASIP